jgi:hypothetical protein
VSEGIPTSATTYRDGTPSSGDAVREELQRILASPNFRSSKLLFVELFVVDILEIFVVIKRSMALGHPGEETLSASLGKRYSVHSTRLAVRESPEFRRRSGRFHAAFRPAVSPYAIYRRKNNDK